jgi:hypothetical protein
MEWQVEFTNEFGEWWESLDEDEQDSVDVSVRLLEKCGPSLVFPHSSKINNSKHWHMRELRVQHKGEPYRVLYAFDPRRVALLLIGGAKGGDDRWYDAHVPLADKIYDQHLREIGLDGEG